MPCGATLYTLITLKVQEHDYGCFANTLYLLAGFAETNYQHLILKLLSRIIWRYFQTFPFNIPNNAAYLPAIISFY